MPSGEGTKTIPPFSVGEVPQADVNEITGEFVFTDIQPGRYAVVVLSQSGAQIPARDYEEGNFAIITIVDKDIDRTVELGYLSFP